MRIPNRPAPHCYFALIVLLAFSTAPLRAAEATDLRGYGKVSADFTANRAVFECESAAKADILLGKLLADLFWDAGGDATESRLDVDGVAVKVHAWAPYGVLTIARIGTQVVAVGEANEQALRTQLLKSRDFLARKPVFSPEKPYPRYLDHYDLRSFKAYTGAMKSGSNLGLQSHWAFLKKFGLGGIAFQSLALVHQYAAPGVINFVQSDYEMREADEQGGVAAIGLGCGGEVPLWIYNRMPEGMMRPSPTTLLGGWTGTGYVGAHYESWWLPPERRESGALLFTREAMERYRDNPALSAWHLYTGAPGAEFGFHARTGEFWDYSPVGVAAFRAWLRDVRKFDLAALGQRWYGDPRHFSRWDQVELPDANGFFGGVDETSIRLTDGWQWASARDGIADPPPAGDPAWIPVAMPPSQQQVMLPWGEAFYRIEFDGREWIRHPRVWLACNALVRSNNPTVIWLNNTKVASVPTGESEPVSVSLAGRLKPGRNTLVVRVPRSGNETGGANEVREGRIFGPVFLTAREPKSYPYLGEQANARTVDLRLWQAAGLASSHRAMLDMALAIDPDHPFNLSGSVVQWPALMTELAEDYGATLQHTGRSSWYHPWWAGLGLIGGFYGTSEEAGTDKATGLTRELGWMLLDGDSNHNLYRDIEDYQLEEQKSGWFTKNQRAIQCFGKYLRAMPQIAILHPGRSLILDSMDWIKWDLGLGDLQAIHFDNAYATETELLKGMADVCPVLIDSGTEIMDDDVAAALQRYVERGGTFVALHHTGRHSNIRQDAQPLARLTGLEAAPHTEGKLSFVAGPPILKAWAGRTFTGSGYSLTPTKSDLIAPGEAPVAIATWSDGGVAIAERRIRKGRVIQIASPFWRDHGEIQREFLEQLLKDLGVVRNADASSAAVWTRKATTKNGLQDWLLTFNNSDAKQKADVRLAVAERPAEVWDILSRKPVNGTYANGFVTIPNVEYEPLGVRIFAVKRADLGNALPFWWGEKTRYWRRPPAASTPGVAAAKQWLAATAAGRMENNETLPFDAWRFLADRGDSVGRKTEWLNPEFDDSRWSPLANGPWNLLDPKLSDWRGAGLYRKKFTVPQPWKGRRVILNLFDWDRPIVYDQGEIFINGAKVADYKAHGWSQAYAYDVTDLLREGSNVLAVRVIGGKEFSGICGNVWLEPERKFVAESDLTGTWQIVKADFKSEEPARLPGKLTGRYLKRDLILPKDWNGKTIFLHIETGVQWLGSVVINGHPINANSSLHPFSPRCEVNLTPYLISGRNRIELWPYTTVPSVLANEPQGEAQMQVTAVRLGVLGSK